MIYCFGEALIDMVMTRPGREEYFVSPGGAPANCAAAAARLGGEAAMVGRVGDDRFGRLIRSALMSKNVDCDHLLLTENAPTSLAFASVDEYGERCFDFYRPYDAVDLRLSAADVSDIRFKKGDVLYFGSNCLMSASFCAALKWALRAARSAGALVACDVNLRPALWRDSREMMTALNEYLPYADIVKMSGGELSSITGVDEPPRAAAHVLSRGINVLFVTYGSRGASVYTSRGERFTCPAKKVDVIDTVGAGDAFFGAALYSLDGVTQVDLPGQNYRMILDFAVAAATLSTTRGGGISSMPAFSEVIKFAEKRDGY